MNNLNKINWGNPYVSRTSGPRVDAIPLVVRLTKDECTRPLIIDYEYTGHETEGMHPYSHSTKVKSFRISNMYRTAETEIIEQKDNHVKFSVKLVSPRFCNMSGSYAHTVRLILYCTMEKPQVRTIPVKVMQEKTRGYYENEPEAVVTDVEDTLVSAVTKRDKAIVQTVYDELNELEDREIIKTVRDHSR